MSLRDILVEMIDEMLGDDIPDRFVRKIEFMVGRDRFEVYPEDFAEWRQCRPEYAHSVRHHVDLARLAYVVETETKKLMRGFNQAKPGD